MNTNIPDQALADDAYEAALDAVFLHVQLGDGAQAALLQASLPHLHWFDVGGLPALPVEEFNLVLASIATSPIAWGAAQPPAVLGHDLYPAAFSGGWVDLMASLSATTLGEIFAPDTLLGLVQDKLAHAIAGASEAIRNQFVLSPDKFFRLSIRRTAANQLGWTDAEWGQVTYLQHSTFGRGFLADPITGDLKNYIIVKLQLGPTYTAAQFSANTLFHRGALIFCQFFRENGASPRLTGNTAADGFERDLLTAEALRLLRHWRQPAILSNYVNLATAESRFSRELCRSFDYNFATAVAGNLPLTFAVDGHYASVLKGCKQLKALIGASPAAWPAVGLSQTISLISRIRFPTAADLPQVSPTYVVELEAWLYDRRHITEDARTEHPSNIALRLQVFERRARSTASVSGSSSGGDIDASAMKSFRSGAEATMNKSEYLTQKRDILVLRTTSMSADDQYGILDLILGGASKVYPDRRPNAVTLTFLFDSAGKYTSLDQDMVFLPQTLKGFFGTYWGVKTRTALDIKPEDCTTQLNLHKLDALLCEKNAIVTKPWRLDVLELMSMPARQNRYPDAAIPAFPRPYASPEGLRRARPLVVTLFTSLGVRPSDGTPKTQPPLSASEFWDAVTAFATQYYDFDPSACGKITESVIYGVFSDWFEYQFEPARSGKGAFYVPSEHLVPIGSKHFAALGSAESWFDSKSKRKREEHSLVDDLLTFSTTDGPYGTGAKAAKTQGQLDVSPLVNKELNETKAKLVSLNLACKPHAQRACMHTSRSHDRQPRATPCTRSVTMHASLFKTAQATLVASHALACSAATKVACLHAPRRLTLAVTAAPRPPCSRSLPS